MTFQCVVPAEMHRRFVREFELFADVLQTLQYFSALR